MLIMLMVVVSFDRQWRTMQIIRHCLLFFGLLLLPSTVLGQTTVYLTPAEALKLVFKDSKEVVSEKKTFSADEKTAVGKKLGSKPAKDTWNFYIARTGNRVDGYALIDNEIGKTEPITFLTAIFPDGSVKAVEILVFRESHGGEVHEERFRKQFTGKKADNPVRAGQDIGNIAGATLSSRAVSL